MEIGLGREGGSEGFVGETDTTSFHFLTIRRGILVSHGLTTYNYVSRLYVSRLPRFVLVCDPCCFQFPSMPERFGRFGVASGSLERKVNGRIPNEWHFARNLTGRDSNKRQLTVRRLAAIKLVFRFNGEASMSDGPAFGGFQRTESYTVVERTLKGR